MTNTISGPERDLIEYLDKLNIQTLRSAGRRYGVPHVSACSKGEIKTALVEILTGRSKPQPKSNRGAPVKQEYIDPKILDDIDALRERVRPQPKQEPLTVMSPKRDEREDAVNTGILEITQSGYGFLRAKNCQPSSDGDVYLPAPLIHALKLREGDLVSCKAHPRVRNESPAIQELLTVNGLPMGKFEQRPFFDTLTAKYANEKIALSQTCGDMALRILDLFVPIGKGQRALIIAPPKAGKTTLLKSVAGAISEGHREISLIILLIDERPEEVTDIRSSVQNAEVIYSTFDEGAEHHIRAAKLTLEHAKRLVEMGKDVVILLDSTTKLTRAYNSAGESTGKTLSGGLDAGALAEPKRFFGAARNTVEAGSLTILATALVDTGSRMDDIIYEEFKGTGNADVFLSRELAERRIFPAIDIRRSGTRKEELLLSKEELDAVYKMRERGLTENVAGLIEMMKKTRDNAEFAARLPEWLRVYKAN